MPEYQVYTPWDSVVVEAENEKKARIAALRQILAEVESATIDDLDAEYVGDLD